MSHEPMWTGTAAEPKAARQERERIIKLLRDLGLVSAAVAIENQLLSNPRHELREALDRVSHSFQQANPKTSVGADAIANAICTLIEVVVWRDKSG